MDSDGTRIHYGRDWAAKSCPERQSGLQVDLEIGKGCRPPPGRARAGPGQTVRHAREGPEGAQAGASVGDCKGASMR
jgi:hypothetical protein